MPRNKIIILLALLILVVSVIIIVRNFSQQRKIRPVPILPLTTMQLTSSAFQNNEHIPSQYTCDGANVNPPLNILEIPKEAESLVLIVDDPDAPRGDWVHWTVWNINPTTASIGENSVPSGAIEGQTDFGKSGYGGPCPPSGTHRYHFKLYALDKELALDKRAKKFDLESAMSGHTLAQSTLVGLYKRR
ncbi:hypothetical protein A3H10_04515 [Candidatus Uhrbacteria bacterium RIFCSPLOWO2_12_FULL_46_10]|uniref:Kinase inhibitor n=1 Tax=Candidatus Uhrbacteria bacterium RIFCSPLOWO2_01_FULL_47_25 TaxID=1802402 RepID=A0A1F7UXL4_9BACT|nr:MAG: Phospholipid-binding protein, PBP family [Parcubacteria group bacterium GW2011_GWA2_46_9]OGL59360.1 MAG: hypothetical protein A2752_05380 [Candidatus Uhrbacteria bacterium RIFCSPHIGHO2_01_FULL_46_23]OGL68995.1 MAG: hypothetical protein A3D60_04435 [Candidatus Uhrbacteria bacterium RIFCSPHIGHO2_02_FULL_47_29]OGL76700.1 MAG: hypothetical protein A3E96_00805 [Candidatus Uhrbacteria bacterium RIFCSPHIGHO2_12_FULL_46_13]OGL82494.1 MAG: hypothetical protein A2936_02445 [Candidatus Uhrbacteria